MFGKKSLLPATLPVTGTEEPQQTRIASQRTALQTMAIIGVLTSTYLYIISELTVKSGGIFALGFLLYLTTVFLYRAGKRKLSKYMLVVTILTSFSLFLFLCGRIDQFVFLGYFIVALLSGMFFEDLQSNIFSGLVALITTGFLLIFTYSAAFSARLPGVRVEEIVFQTIFLILAALVGRALARELDNAVKKLVALSLKAQAIFDQSTDAIFITDLDFKITEMNLQAEEMLGLPLEEVLGKNLVEFSPESDRRQINELINDIRSTGSISKVEVTFTQSEGEDQHIQISSNLIFGGLQNPDHIQVILRDITARKQAEQLVQRLAMQDHLTKADNRLSLQYRLNSMVVQKKHTEGKFALVYFDLDHFKSVNDQFGHAVGDQLLIAFTRRLSGAIRRGDFLARVGGDEFVLILEYDSSKADFEPTLERIRKSLAEPFKIKTHLIPLTVSYGISFFPEDAEEAEMLLRLADTAMYSSKNG